MECCYPVDCGQYAVTPVLMAPGYPAKYCEDPPMCYPCLPRCPQGQIAYGREQKTNSISRTPPDQHHMENECNIHQNQRQRSSTPSRQFKRSPTSASNSPNTNNCQPPPNYCPTCYQPTYKPVKTKYVIPCYRYEDGRIEQYVPTRSGRLPMSAYRRNGMQDQIHGYKGAIRYICAGKSVQGSCVYTAIEPLQRIYPKVTQEMPAVRKTKDKRLTHCRRLL